MTSIKRQQLFTLFVLFIAFIGFVNAFRFGAASLDYYLVRNAIEAWQVDAHIQSKSDFEQAKRAIDTANLLHRSNPFYMDLAGQINEWGAVSGFDPQTGLALAKRHYIEASKARPLWPVTWANLAMVKWRLQEFDEEMLMYLDKADDLGPQSVEVHILYTRLGLTLYNANHPMYTSIKDRVHRRLRLGLRNGQSRPSVVDFIHSSQSLPVVCRWLQKEDKYTASQHLLCP